MSGIKKIIHTSLLEYSVSKYKETNFLVCKPSLGDYDNNKIITIRSLFL